MLFLFWVTVKICLIDLGWYRFGKKSLEEINCLSLEAVMGEMKPHTQNRVEMKVPSDSSVSFFEATLTFPLSSSSTESPVCV